MPFSGAALAYSVAGSLILFSGIKGASLSDTVRGALTGNLGNVKSLPVTGSADTTSAVQAAAPSGPAESDWINSFLTDIGAPKTQANIDSMSSWISHETPWPPVAAFNPLNTTLDMSGATDYNSVGVKNYVSSQQGIEAIVSTIEGGQYNDVLMALRSGNGLCGRSWQGLSTWSGGGYSEVC